MDVHTGDVDNASTNANVYITVYGERGDTGKRRLLKSDNFNKFENNQVIHVLISLKYVTNILYMNDLGGLLYLHCYCRVCYVILVKWYVVF